MAAAVGIWAFGLYTLLSQVILVRESMVVLEGNELTIGLLFACWLSGIAIGAFCGTPLSRSMRRSSWTLAVVLILLALMVPISIYILRLLRPLLSLPQGVALSFSNIALGTLLAVMPVGLLIGAAFPALCRILALSRGILSIGRVYIIEALGSLAGGLLFTFWMVTAFDVFTSVALGAFVMMGSGALFLAGIRQRSASLLTGLAALVVLALLVTGTFGVIHHASNRDRFAVNAPGSKLLATAETPFGHFDLGQQGGQLAAYSNGRVAFVLPDGDRRRKAHLWLLEHPEPHNVLLVGVGSYELIPVILSHSVRHLDYVEFDPGLRSLILPYLSAPLRKSLADERVQVHAGDGRFFIRHARQRYDLIIIDLSDPSTAALNRFYTVDFYREVLSALSPRGVLITGSQSGASAVDDALADYTGAIFHSLRQVFIEVKIIAGSRATFLASNTKGVVSLKPEVLARRLKARPGVKDYLAPLISYDLPTMRSRQLTRWLQKKRGLRVNSDQSPIAYFFNLVLWDLASTTTGKNRGEQGKIFRWLAGLNSLWIFIPLVLLGLLRLGFLMFNRQNRPRTPVAHSLVAMGTTGFGGMALEVVVLLAFQSHYGYLYRELGLLVALFMVGIALGGYAGNRLVSSSRFNKPLKLLLGAEFSVCALALLTPLILEAGAAMAGGGGGGLPYFFLMLAAGGITGLQYPLTSWVMMASGLPLGTTAGLIDGADHLGAAFGALAAGIILVPLLGMTATCLLVVLLNGISMLWIAFDCPGHLHHDMM